MFLSVTGQAVQKPPSNISKPARRGQTLVLGLLLVLYLASALAHAALAPLTTGPDELAHYEYVNFIANHGRLPLNAEERGQASYKSDQPPIYHLITALPAALVDPSGPPYLKRYGDHLRRQLIERTRHAWGLYNTEDERWPYQGEILRWHIGRWVAILFGAATVLVTYFIAREVFAGDGWLALTAAATLAFIPRFLLSGSMLNYETTLAFFSALFLWVLLRIASREGVDGELSPATRGLRPVFYTVLLGLFAGLALTTKLSALILPLEIAVGLGLIARQYNWGWRVWALRVGLAGLAVLAPVSGWFGFVIYQFNTVAEQGWWVGLMQPLIAADASDATTNRLLNLLSGGQAGFTGALDDLETGPPWLWLSIFFRTFWAADIEKNFPLGSLGFVVVLGLSSLAVIGLMTTWVKGKEGESHLAAGPGEETAGPTGLTPSQRLIVSLLGLHLGMALILPVIRYAATLSLADTAQGRHLLFQAAPAIAILLVWGLVAASRNAYYVLRLADHGSQTFALSAPLFLLFWSLVQLQTMTWAYLPPLPVWTRTEAPAPMSHRLEQPLNEAVTLLGYETRLDSQTRMLRVDLWWQATALSPVDYLTGIKLLDGQGEVQAQWVGYSANGRYPTRAWDVGDRVQDTAWLPTGGLEAGAYSLSLELLPALVNPAASPAAPAVISLGTVTLNEATLRIFDRSLPFASDIARAASGYSVWQDGQSLTTPRSFDYRETILITLHPLLPDQERLVRLMGPPLSTAEHEHAFAPVLEAETWALFIVGPDWPTGDYHLRVSLAEAGQAEQQVNTAPLLRVENRWERHYTEPPIPHRLEANFANQVKLLGYALGSNRTEPGQGVPVTLYWQGLDWMGENYTLFIKLLAADQTVHGGRDRLPQEGYSTLYWAPGEIITDAFGVPVDAHAPQGVYYLNVGLYRNVAQQAHSLPLMQDGQFLDQTSLNLGPIKVGQAPPAFTLTKANPQHSLNQPLGEAPHLTLIGYDLANENQQNLKLKLYWRSEAVLPLDYTIFVHIRNEAGEMVAQKDQPPLQGAYPTSLWDPGEIVADEIVIPLPPALDDSYEIVVGMYDFNTGARLPVPGYPENGIPLGRWELKP